MIPALIVPFLTRPELLGRMLHSIDYPINHLVVIDNADHEEIMIGSRHANHVSLISLPHNLGVAGSWNLGIKTTPFSKWWLISNFDVTWPAGSLERFARLSGPDNLVLSAGAPPWCAFSIGENIIQFCGLFDEMFHPGYFEDNDMERRVRAEGFNVIQSDIPVDHDNSSTLRAGFQHKNDQTFAENHAYYQAKLAAGDVSEGRWSLPRRRRLSWD